MDTSGPLRLDRPILLVVDLQNGDAHPASAYVRRKAGELGHDAERYYVSRLRDVVIPNVERLRKAFASAERSVIYARIQSLTADGRDRGSGHKMRGIHFPPGSWDGEILAEVAPGPNDIVLSKTASSAFVATGLGELIGNLGGRDLVVLGAVTGSCVQATVLDALGRAEGGVAVVDDASAAWSAERHGEALGAMRTAGARVVTTDDVVGALAQPSALPA
jgi:nicotinamidase-related amidase